MKKFKPGDIVRTPQGVGGVLEVLKSDLVRVTYGADGPVERWFVASLRWATDDEKARFTGRG